MKKAISLFLAILLLCGVMASCAAPSAPQSGTPSAPAAAPEEGGSASAPAAASGKPIKIGLPAPLSGSSGAIGTTLVNAAKLAIDQVNAAGGVHGRPVELFTEDDEMTAAKAVTVVNKLIYQDGVDALIGCLNSTACLAAQEITNKAGMIQIALGSNYTITEQGHKYVFRMQANDLYQAAAVVKYVVDTLGYKRIACIYASDDFGTGGKNVVDKELKARGLDLVACEAFDPDASDVTSQLTSIKAANPEAVIMWNMYQAGALICKQMNQMGMGDIPKFGGGGLVNKALYELAGESSVGLCMTQLFFPSPESANEKGKQFITDYEAAYGVSPDNNSGMVYDAAMVLMTAMQNAPETMTSDEIKAELHKLEYQGVTGAITFSEKGDAMRDLTIVRIAQGGKYEIAYNPNEN